MSIFDDDFEMDEEYISECELLLQQIEVRDEMRKLLCIARPSQIAGIRQCLAKLGEAIELIEVCIEAIAKKLRCQKDREEKENELLEMCGKIEEGLREHLTKNEPEKLEAFEAMIGYDGIYH